MRRSGWIATAVFLTLVAIGLWQRATEPRPDPKALVAAKADAEARDARIIAAVEKALAQGLIRRIDWRLNRADIDPRAWAALDAEGKRNLARILAAYCAAKGDVARITLYDARTARELAAVSAGRVDVK